MGTTGLTVYNYKRLQYAKGSSSSSYPESLGVKILREIPKPSDGDGWQTRFEEWLQKHRDMVDEINAKVTRDMSPEQVARADALQSRNREEEVLFYFNGKRNLNDVWHEWVYEMDLNNLCFLIDDYPVYRLDNMPTEQIFLYDNGDEPVSLDGDEEECWKHAYIHKDILRPSEEDPTILQKYSLFCAGTAAPHEILGISETLSHAETLRLRWVETMVGCAKYMGGQRAVKELIVLRLEANGGASALDAIPDRTRDKLMDLMYQIFRHQVYTGSHDMWLGREPRHTLPGYPNIYLLRRTVVFQIQNHLDNPSCLHTSSYNLFKAIMDNFAAPIAQEPFVFGVLFSGTRCAVVRVDRKEARFTHTATMPFFQTDESRSTTGITTLARLASKRDPDYFVEHGFSRFLGRSTVVPSHGGLFEKLPLEIIHMIADLCSYNFPLLRKFSNICKRTRDVGLDVSVRHIFIDRLRLVEAIDETDFPGFEEAVEDYLEENYLCSRVFTAETAENDRVLCILGYKKRCVWGTNVTPFESTNLEPVDEMCCGCFSMDGKEISGRTLGILL